MDRVFDSAARHPGAIGQITSLDEAHTTVLLDEIVSQVAERPRLVDPRVRQLRAQDPILADTLRAYLDGFGDVAAVAQRLHVHPNTVRYRVRRIEKLVSTIAGRPRRAAGACAGIAGHRTVAGPANEPGVNRSMDTKFIRQGVARTASDRRTMAS